MGGGAGERLGGDAVSALVLFSLYMRRSTLLGTRCVLLVLPWRDERDCIPILDAVFPGCVLDEMSWVVPKILLYSLHAYMRR